MFRSATLSLALALAVFALLLPRGARALYAPGDDCADQPVGTIAPLQIHAASTGYCSQIVCTIGGVWASRADALWIGVNIYETPRTDVKPNVIGVNPVTGLPDTITATDGYEGGPFHANLIPLRNIGPNPAYDPFFPSGVDEFLYDRVRPEGLDPTNTDAEMRATLLRSFEMSMCSDTNVLTTQCETRVCGWSTHTSGAGCHAEILPNYLEADRLLFWRKGAAYPTNGFNQLNRFDPVGPGPLWAIFDTWLSHNERASARHTPTEDEPVAPTFLTTEEIFLGNRVHDARIRNIPDLNTGGEYYFGTPEAAAKAALVEALGDQGVLVRQMPPRMEGLIQLAYQSDLMTHHDVPVTGCDAPTPTVLSIAELALLGQSAPACPCLQWNGDNWPRTTTDPMAFGTFFSHPALFEGSALIGVCYPVAPRLGTNYATLTANALSPEHMVAAHTPADPARDGRLIGRGEGTRPCTPSSFLHPCIDDFCEHGVCGKSRDGGSATEPAYVVARDSSCHGPTTCFLETGASTQPTCDLRHPINLGGRPKAGCGWSILVLAADGTECTVNAPVAETSADDAVHRLITGGNRMGGAGAFPAGTYPVTISTFTSPAAALNDPCFEHANCSTTAFCRPATPNDPVARCRYALGELLGPFTRGPLPGSTDIGGGCSIDSNCFDGQCIDGQCRHGYETPALKWCAAGGEVVILNGGGGFVTQNSASVELQYHIRCAVRDGVDATNNLFNYSYVAPYNLRRMCASNHFAFGTSCNACGQGTCAQDFHTCIDGVCVYIEPPPLFVPPLDPGLDTRCIETYQVGGAPGIANQRWTGQCKSFSRLTTATYERQDIETANGWPFDPTYRTRVPPGYRSGVPYTGPPEVRGQCVPKMRDYGYVVALEPTDPVPVCRRLICDGAGQTTTEFFVAGTPCYPGPNGLIPPVTPDTPTCGASECDGAGGCVFVARPATTPCDDGDPCTNNDFCDGAGTCAGAPRFASPRVCVRCTFPNNDECACTSSGTCDAAGYCVGGIPLFASSSITLGPITDPIALQPTDPVPATVFDLYVHPAMAGVVPCRADNACLGATGDGICYAGGLCGPYPSVSQWVPGPPPADVDCVLDYDKFRFTEFNYLGGPDTLLTVVPDRTPGGTPLGYTGLEPATCDNRNLAFVHGLYDAAVSADFASNPSSGTPTTPLPPFPTTNLIFSVEWDVIGTIATALIPFNSVPTVITGGATPTYAGPFLPLTFTSTGNPLGPFETLDPVTGAYANTNTAEYVDVSNFGVGSGRQITVSSANYPNISIVVGLAPFPAPCWRDVDCVAKDPTKPICTTRDNMFGCYAPITCGEPGHTCTTGPTLTSPPGLNPQDVADACTHTNAPETSGLEDQCVDVGAASACVAHPDAPAPATPGDQVPMTCPVVVLPTGTPCADDTPCTRDDLSVCDAGVCQHYTTPCSGATSSHLECVGEQVCEGYYEAGTGAPVTSCTETFLPQGTPCASACLTRPAPGGAAGRVSGGTCVFGTCIGTGLVCTDTIGPLADEFCEVVECDEANVQTSAVALAGIAAAQLSGDEIAENAWRHCKREATDVAEGVWLIDGRCTDNNACTLLDGCRGGNTCSFGDVKRCPDPPLCQELAICNPLNAECVINPTTQGTPCDDGDPCTFNDVCDGVSACAGTERDCNTEFAVPACSLTAYFCEPIGDGICVETPLTGVIGSPCNDGNPCTVQDVCVGALSCQGSAVTCPDAPAPAAGVDPQCQNSAGTCTGLSSEGFPLCTYGTTPGVACFSNALDGCTTGDTCNAAGACVPGPAEQCSAPPVCHAGGPSVCAGGACRYRPLPTTDPAFACACDPATDGPDCACGDAAGGPCTGECSLGFCTAVCVPPCAAGETCSGTNPRTCTVAPPSVCELEDPLQCLRDLCEIEEGAGLSVLEAFEQCVRVNVIKGPLGLAFLVVLAALALTLLAFLVVWLPHCCTCCSGCCVRTVTTGLPDLGPPSANAVTWHGVKVAPAASVALVSTKGPVRMRQSVPADGANRTPAAMGESKKSGRAKGE